MKLLLHQTDLEKYKDIGYLVIPKLFSKEECNDMVGMFDGLAAGGYPPILNLDRWDMRVEKIAHSMRLTDIVVALQTNLVSIVSTQILYKKAHSLFAAQAWNVHQDSSYSGTVPGVYMTANIILEDTDKGNGCIYVYPESHKGGVLPFDPFPSGYKDAGNEIREVATLGDSIDMVLSKGDVFFMSGELAHGSYGNESNRDRPMFSVCYITRHAEFFRGKSANRKEIYV